MTLSLSSLFALSMMMGTRAPRGSCLSSLQTSRPLIPGSMRYEEDEVGALPERGLDGRRAVSGGAGVVAVLPEVHGEELDDVRLVVDDQDLPARAHCRTP